MRSSPLARILLPLGVVLLLATLASFFMRDVKVKTAPAAVPHKVPRLISKLSDIYELDRTIAPDGTVYTLRHYEWLRADKPDGKQKWETRIVTREYETDDGIDAIAVSRQGTIYATSNNNGWLYGIGSDGKVLWKAQMYSPHELQIAAHKIKDDANFPMHGEPLVGPNDDAFVLMRHSLICFGTDGKEKWDCELREPGENVEFMAHPMVGYDGTVYIAKEAMGPSAGGLRAVSPAGKLLWKKPLAGRCSVSPCTDLIIDAAGEVAGGHVTAYDHNWNKLWEADVTPRVFAFDNAGNTYAITWDSRVVAYGPGGKQLWSVPTTATVDLCVKGSGPVFTLDEMKARVAALDPATGKTLWDATPSEVDKLAAIEAQAKENSADMGYGPNGEKLEPERYPFALTFLTVNQQGTAYFSGTGNWLFAAGP